MRQRQPIKSSSIPYNRAAVQAAIEDSVFAETVEQIGREDCQLFFTGFHRGMRGSACEQRRQRGRHAAPRGRVLSRLNCDRAPVAAVALTTDRSVLTAIDDGYGYERVFERQDKGLGRAGDVFVAISTSGRSRDILRAIDAARRMGPTIVGVTGRSGSETASRCDLCLHAPADATPLIQQIHITAGHIACGLGEERLFPRAGRVRGFSNATE